MSTFDLNSINSELSDSGRPTSGVDFSGKSLKLDTANDAQPIVDAINGCPDLQYLTLTGNTLGVSAVQVISKALEQHPELKVARFSDMFTGRMKTEIPPALAALGDGMITAGARLRFLDLSDNAFGPIGVEGLAKLLKSDVCSELEELRLNNNGLGITGGRLLAEALSARPRKLKIFIAGRNRLENDGATALAKVFQNMGTLEELAMPQNGIYHIGISALSEAFKHNAQLARLNLNDNTVGAEGAQAIAAALPNLKNLKCINFGDCLLKSKGASALAKAFKENSVLLESLDLSHNEIGRDACMELVDAITALPDSYHRLSRVVLAGNSLGGASDKKSMRDKLGASAELSDGEGSEVEYVTDSTEHAQHFDTFTEFPNDITLDSSGNSLGGASDKKSMRDKLGASAELSDGEGSEVEYVTDSTEHAQHFDTFTEFPNDITLDSSGNSLGGASDKKSMRDKLGASAELSDGEGSEVEYVTDSTEHAQHFDTFTEFPNDITLDSSGNSLGGASDKKSMRDKLGASAELSDGEGSEVEYVTDSTEHAQHFDTFTEFPNDITLDSSGVEEIESDVDRFLAQPTVENLNRLGANAADVIDVHLQAIKDPTALIQAYVEATFCVAGLSEQYPKAAEIAGQMYPILIKKAGQQHAAVWILADTMLSALGLIKNEDETRKIRWALGPCYTSLSRVIDAHYFPSALRDTIRLFASNKKSAVPLAASLCR